jgi:hypothetical protein
MTMTPLADYKRPVWVDTVEKLRFTMTGKFLRTFCSRVAQITVAFPASEALLGGFSCAIYHPLISRVRKSA